MHVIIENFEKRILSKTILPHKLPLGKIIQNLTWKFQAGIPIGIKFSLRVKISTKKFFIKRDKICHLSSNRFLL